MYFYLKDEVIEDLRTVWANREQPHKIRTDDDSGESYIAVYDDPLDPTFAMEEIPKEAIDRVTYHGEVDNHHCFRAEGIYQLGEGILQCSIMNYILRSGTMGYGDDTLNPKMVVKVSAPTLSALQEIYSQFRQGKLQPVENWEAPQIEKVESSEDDDASDDSSTN